MFKQELEVRGIHRKSILQYVHELGGHSQTDSELFRGTDWECCVSEESYFRFLQSDVPQVKVIFSSLNERSLQETIKKFRLKTFRAGG